MMNTRPTGTGSAAPASQSAEGPHIPPRPLEVLWLIKGLGPGGAERLLVAASGAHDPAAVALSCAYVLDGKHHLARALAFNGVTVRPLGVQRGLDPRWVWRLLRLLRNRDYDVVHSHSPTVALAARVLVRSRLAGRDRSVLVTTEHNAWPTLHPLTRLAAIATTWMDDASISVSDETRRSLWPARLQRRSVTIVHGIDLDAVRAALVDRQAVRDELCIADTAVVVATVANYRTQKNYPNLLRAATLAIADVRVSGRELTFVAAGQGPLAADIEAMHTELGLGSSLRLLGHRADAVRILAASDVFVLASDYEGQPVALMEALALGLPVVATAVGGVAEVMTHDAGILVEPDDSTALAGALVEMVADDVRRSAASIAAARLGERFDVERTVGEIEEIYRRITR